MTAYADTNFFTAAHLVSERSAGARTLIDKLRGSPSAPLPVTMLVKMEFTNALQRSVFVSREGSQPLRITPEQVLLAEDAFIQEFRAGEVYRESPLALESLESTFEMLAHRHTAKWGFRTYDILHVASALVLGCDTFWTFDVKAKKLAKLEGLATN